MTFGKHSAGIVDEVRIWKATIQENRLLQNIYNTLDTTDVYSRGLVAYYPFEKDAVVYGEKKKVFILDDMAPGQPRHSRTPSWRRSWTPHRWHLSARWSSG